LWSAIINIAVREMRSTVIVMTAIVGITISMVIVVAGIVPSAVIRRCRPVERITKIDIKAPIGIPAAMTAPPIAGAIMPIGLIPPVIHQHRTVQVNVDVIILIVIDQLSSVLGLIIVFIFCIIVVYHNTITLSGGYTNLSITPRKCQHQHNTQSGEYIKSSFHDCAS
jgi:hypothetical protein